MEQTYTKEQMNVVLAHYEREILRLNKIIGGDLLKILSDGKRVDELTKQNAELRKLSNEQKVKVSDTRDDHSSNGVDNKKDKNNLQNIP